MRLRWTRVARTRGRSKLHLKPGVHVLVIPWISRVTLQPWVNVHILHSHGDLLLLLSGHHLGLLSLLGSQSLSPGHVSSSYSSRVVARHCCCVRD